MNAYSSIARERHGVARRLRSRAFRSGLLEGLGAPALTVLRREYCLNNSIDASVASAWKAVEKALKSATDERDAQIGKITRETKSAE